MKYAGDLESSLSGILLGDVWHRKTLEALHDFAPFAWITGGFVRNAIWDAVFDKGGFCTPADVDVIYLDHQRSLQLAEKGLEEALRRNSKDILWSVKDQSRMHMRGDDPPYRSLDQALRAFPDRSSAIAVRLPANRKLEILAPFGLEDAFRGIVRPTPIGRSDIRYQRFLDRKLDGWRNRWPRLLVASAVSGKGHSRKAA
ncbi:MAG TPA: nucleotidyltransferase family protein [Solirubrobacterales bacterium]|nr:nucleotidyltransferase family protein [Solirubrobacterales bacterium]